jgi:predicted nucleotidyltransferase
MILPEDFRDFLKLLNKYRVEYLLIGGYAVFYHGYPRATEDIDFWVAINPDNAQKLVQVMQDFGLSNATPELFLKEHQLTRIGFKPYRVKVLTTISGVQFDACYARRVVDTIDGIEVNIISLEDLKQKASGRLKDQDDVQNLP